jgi:UDP-N-acetyl-D-galactosamine dehydrogenase
MTAAPQAGEYDLIILAVAHTVFTKPGADGIRAFGKATSVLYDVISALPRDAVDGRL